MKTHHLIAALAIAACASADAKKVDATDRRFAFVASFALDDRMPMIRIDDLHYCHVAYDMLSRQGFCRYQAILPDLTQDRTLPYSTCRVLWILRGQIRCPEIVRTTLRLDHMP